MVYVGRSCATVPPLGDVVWNRPPASALRATVPEVMDRHLECFVSKLQASIPVKMVFYGSSVTAGLRCKHTKERSVNFPQQVVQLIEHRFPQANVTADVFGYPGASPSFMTACHNTLMRTDAADLYVVEMTDNLADGYEGVGRSAERLLGAIRQRAPSAALMLLAPIPQRCVRSLKRMKPFQHVPLDDDSTRGLLARNCYSNNSVAASFEDVGAAHNISTVSARHLVGEQLWRNPSSAGRIISKLHYDAVHPSGGGHWQLAVAIEFALRKQQRPHGLQQRKWRAGQLREASHGVCGSPPQPGEFEARNLFAPRSADAAQGTRLVCAHGHGDYLKEHIIRSSGWNFEVERNSQGLAKPGYIARTPGATLELCHRPQLRREQLLGQHNRLTVPVAWSLGYLMSYEHMGKMRGECVPSEGSCSCGARVFNAHWRLPISQPHISRLKLQIRYARRNANSMLVPERALRQHTDDTTAATTCPCVIRLTLLNESDSGEHKFKLVSLTSGFYTSTIEVKANIFA